MHKQVLSQLLNASLNISSEHQRDLTDSASSRFYAVSFACVAAMTQRLNKVMSKLEVNEAAMSRNLYLTAGAIAAEPLYLLLEKYGHTAAHELSKDLAHAALQQKQSLKDAVLNNQEAATYWQKFTAGERRIIEQPEQYYTGKAVAKTRDIINTWK